MITPLTYGFNGRTSMAYYYVGRAGDFAKFGIAGAVVEGSWLTAQQVNFSSPISNLNSRKVDTYTNVRSTLRFFDGLTGTIHVLPLFIKRPMAIPMDATWVPYS